MPAPPNLLTPPVRPCPIVLFPVRDESLSGIRLRRSSGHVRVRPGVYAPAEDWQALRPWERYLARVHAFALAHPDAVFCLESAAVLLGLPIFGEPTDVHVFDPRRDRGRRCGDVSVHEGENGKAVVGVGGLLVTSVADTTLDLLRVLPPAFALAVGDAAARHPGAASSPDALRSIADAQTNRRGRGRLEWVLPRIDARSESVGESVSRAVIEWCGYPAPRLQQTFRYEGAEDRSDFFFPEERVIGEADGYGKYLSGASAAPRRLRDEKTREDRLRRHVRGFARWDYADAMRATPLDEKLARAGVRRIRPPQPALLATLRSHPRSSPRAH